MKYFVIEASSVSNDPMQKRLLKKIQGMKL